MTAKKKIEETQELLQSQFSLRFPFFNQRFLIIGARESANGVSCKFALALTPYVYSPPDAEEHRRHGAKWIMHVPNIRTWSSQCRDLLIKTVLDEVDEYITKGHIERAEETIVSFDDDERIRLQRTGNRAVN